MKSSVGNSIRICVIVLTVLLVLLVFSAPPLIRSDSWPMFFNNPEHTTNTTSTAPDTNITLWTRPLLGGQGYSSPIVANGRVFVNRGGWGTLHSLYETNGSEIWNRYIGVAGEACSTPAVADGKVYIVGDKVYCFFENNGTEIWNKSVSGFSAGTSSPMVADGKIFVNTGTLYCFYANNGTERWNRSVGGSGESTPAVANGRVLVNGENLYCFYINNGTEIWNMTGGIPSSSSPVVVNGKVFWNPWSIYCLYEDNGTEIWSQPNGGDRYSSPAIANGKVFVNVAITFPTMISIIYCYYENNGTEMWNVTRPGEGCSTPAISGDGKVFVTAGSYLYCFNENDGEEIWNRSTGGLGYSSPAIANGKVFVNQQTIYCFGVGGPPPTVDYVVIEDDANNELDTVTLEISGSLTIYAAGYNSSTSSFVKYVEVEWTESGGLGDFNPQEGTSTTYTAGTSLGTTTIKAENVTLGWSDEFTVKIFYNIVLKQGWNLISIPLIQEDQSLAKVLGSIDGWYDAVRWYDSSDTNDRFKHLKIGKPFGNDLSELNETMGFWIYITEPGDTNFLYNGTYPTENQSVVLYKGWNLVGYPSLSNKNRTAALNKITFGTDVDVIMTYNSTIQEWEVLDENDFFELGRGYWIHSLEEITWEVTL